MTRVSRATAACGWALAGAFAAAGLVVGFSGRLAAGVVLLLMAAILGEGALR